MSATPRPAVNQWIRGQTRGTVTDSARWRENVPLNVNDDDFTVSRNQYRH